MLNFELIFTPIHISDSWYHILHPFILCFYLYFYITVLLSFSFELLFLLVLLTVLFFTHRVPHNISWRTSLMVMNSFNFYLSGKLFISPSIVNDSFASKTIPGCRFFPFSALAISGHFLLAYQVSDEISADGLIGFPLYATVFFSLATFNILYHFYFHFSYCVLVWTSLH